MSQVLQVRQEQVREAIERNKQHQEEVLLHKAHLERQIQQSKAMEIAEHEKRLKIREEYSNILAEQIKDIEQRKVIEKRNLELEMQREKVYIGSFRMNIAESNKYYKMV